MAWGVFKKIKDGLYKAGKAVANVAGKVWNGAKQVLPKIGGIVGVAAPALNQLAPGAGTALQTGYSAANNFMNSSAATGINNWMAAHG
jgi:hypothetical protein